MCPTSNAVAFQILMDAYGIIEPVDINRWEKTLKPADGPKVDPGNHFSPPRINAYGCVQKDLAKAIEISTSFLLPSEHNQLDAVVFEAMINVLVATSKKTDLRIRIYLGR